MKTILVPTDFSENANQALKYAAVLAKKTGAEIMLLYVYDIMVPADGTPLMPYAHELMAEESNKMLTQTATNLIPTEIKYRYKSILGSAVHKIVKEARENNADLIVMGIRGTNRLSQIIIGSTTTSVLRNTKIPVFVIPENAKAELPLNILFAYDGKQVPAKETMKPFIDLAENIKSEILALNVLSEVEAELLDKRYIARETFHALKGTNYSVHFAEDGDVLHGINNFIETHKIDAVAMIYHPIGFFGRLFMESRAHKMAFYTKLPLLILPES